MDALFFPDDLQYLLWQEMEVITDTVMFLKHLEIPDSHFSLPAELDGAVLHYYRTWENYNLDASISNQSVITVWDIVSSG